MITAIALGGYPLLTSQIYLQNFQNGSFPATVYTRSKRGGYAGSKLITPSFSSYQFVAVFTIVGSSFANLVTQRTAFFQILGYIHSAGAQTLILTRSDGTQVQIDVKAVAVTGDFSTDDGLKSTVQVTFECEYPFLQSSQLKSQDVLLSNGGGMSIPMGIPLDLSHGAAAPINITNGGNYPAYPTFTFVGPLTNPTITDETTGESLAIAQTLASSAYSVVVDCYQRTVILQPSGNVGRQYMTGTFWTIPLGQISVQLGNDNGTDTGKCTISYRDTFLNI